MTSNPLPDAWSAYMTWRAFTWDGVYNARCPCGADGTWNAYRNEPLCGCECYTEMER